MLLHGLQRRRELCRLLHVELVEVIVGFDAQLVHLRRRDTHSVAIFRPLEQRNLPFLAGQSQHLPFLAGQSQRKLPGKNY